jgi:hypothetical protein
MLSVVSALCMFYFKFQRQPVTIDNLKQGLSGIHPYIRPETVIGFKTTPSPNVELAAHIASILAPVPFDFDMQDTTLFLLPLNIADASTLSLLKQKTVIWQNKDNQYQYILARTP